MDRAVRSGSLRYLDSPQFAWLADTFWYDYGRMELGVESAFQTPYFGGEYSEDVAEHLQEIVLGNSDHAAADLHVLYDTQNEVILGSGLTYHRE